MAYFKHLYFQNLFFTFYFFARTDPEKQFLRLISHISLIRSKVHWLRSPITIYVEHNLGFEARCFPPFLLALLLLLHHHLR